MPLRGPGGTNPSSTTSDPLITACFYGLLASMAVVAALPALVVGPVLYLVASWRGWRWWTLTLPGLAIIAAAVCLGWTIGGDPTAALTWHALGARELFAATPQGPPIADLVAARWPTWVLHELPLSIGAALVGTGMVIDHLGSTPGHELSFGAQRRRARLADHRVARARTAAAAPATAGPKAQPVLGAWIDGDLAAWRSGRWATIPPSVLGLRGQKGVPIATLQGAKINDRTAGCRRPFRWRRPDARWHQGLCGPQAESAVLVGSGEPRLSRAPAL